MNQHQQENEKINQMSEPLNEEQQWWMSRAFIVSHWIRMNPNFRGIDDNNADVWLIQDDQISTIPEISASSSENPIDDNKFKWFECGLQMSESKQELEEHDIAIKEQIQMGIIQVQKPLSFNGMNMGGMQISGPQQINKPIPSFNIAKTPGGPQIGNNTSFEQNSLSRSMALSLGLVPNQQKVQPNTKIGRNDKCPCGSGKKFKVCCGRGS